MQTNWCQNPLPRLLRRIAELPLPARNESRHGSSEIVPLAAYAKSRRGTNPAIAPLKLLAIGLAAVGLMGGCAGAQRVVITEPVGPVRAVARPENATGKLVVYSGWDRYDTLDSQHQKHTPYTVLSEEKGTALRVRNSRGSFGEEPEAVPLPAGKYLVKAWATNVGPVQVPVMIREGETTEVYLDSLSSPAASLPNESAWVKQPNGQIVGWRDHGDVK